MCVKWVRTTWIFDFDLSYDHHTKGYLGINQFLYHVQDVQQYWFRDWQNNNSNLRVYIFLQKWILEFSSILICIFSCLNVYKKACQFKEFAFHKKMAKRTLFKKIFLTRSRLQFLMVVGTQAVPVFWVFYLEVEGFLSQPLSSIYIIRNTN